MKLSKKNIKYLKQKGFHCDFCNKMVKWRLDYREEYGGFIKYGVCCATYFSLKALFDENGNPIKNLDFQHYSTRNNH